jgi:cytochrome c553
MTRIGRSSVVAAAVVGIAALCPAWPAAAADANRGAVIAAQGVAGAPACAQCHGFRGASDGTGAFPRIDGQPAEYLEQQTRDFASSDRQDALMSPIAKALSAADIADVAAYYAGSSREFLPSAAADGALVEKGRQVAQQGDDAKGILACDNCHGPDSVNIPAAIPYLAGQYAHYTAFALQMWKRGLRKNSPDLMAPMAKQLDDQAIAAVAAYYQQVRSPAGAQGAARQAEPGRGAMIAAHGVADATACAQCHGFSGASDSGATFPRIAGQSAYYLEKQMRDFASSARPNAVMSPIAKALSPDEIVDVSKYYAGNDGEFPPLATADTALAEKGRQLARVGDSAKDIQACNNCHGPDGAGIPPAIPYLAGQYAQYIAFELQMWKRGFRKSSADSMALIAKQLDDQQIAAVAAYYQQIRGSAGAAVSKR